MTRRGGGDFVKSWCQPINVIFLKFHTIRLNFFSSKLVRRHLAQATKDLTPNKKFMFRGIGRGKGWKLLVEVSWKDIRGIGLDPLSLRTYVFIKQLCVETGWKADVSQGGGIFGQNLTKADKGGKGVNFYQILADVICEPSLTFVTDLRLLDNLCKLSEWFVKMIEWTSPCLVLLTL